MDKKSIKNPKHKPALSGLLRLVMPWTAVLMLTAGLTALAQMRWTTSLFSGLFLVGFLLVAQPLLETLWSRAKAAQNKMGQIVRSFAER